MHRRLFVCAIFLTVFAIDMGAQGFVNPGNIQFQNTNGDDPSGMRRVDVYWDDFDIPPSTDLFNYTLDVQVNMGTNSLTGTCVSEALSQSYVHPAFPSGSLTVINGSAVAFNAKNIEDLDLNALEGNNPILLFSIVYIGAANSNVTATWNTSTQAPRIYTLSSSPPQSWFCEQLNNNKVRTIATNTITGSIYKPAFTQATCSQGQNNAVTQVNITRTPNVTCGTTLTPVTISNGTNGAYAFQNNPGGINQSLPKYFDYTISPVKTNGIACGLNGIDITLVEGHITGADIFDYPYQLIAADMNLDGSVTTFDKVIIQRVINGNTSDLPTGWRSWAFPPTAVYGTFTPPSNSNSVPTFNEYIQFNDLNSNFTIQDFVGIKRGDVDGSCSQCNAAFDGGGSEDRETNPSNSLILSNISVRVGEIIELPLQIESWDEDNNVISFALQFDPSFFDFLTVKDGVLPNFDENSFNWEAMDEGLLRCVWVNNYGEKHHLKKEDALLYVVFRAKANMSSLKNLVQIRPDVQDCSVVTTALKQDFLDLRFVQKDERSGFSEVTAYPNPFGDKLNLELNIEGGGEATVEVLSLDGRKLYISKLKLEAGTQYIAIPTQNFPSGLLAYRVFTSSKEFSGRVVKR